MMKYPVIELTRDRYPPKLLEIPDPPQELYIRGKLPEFNTVKSLAVVGARNYSSYGREVCEKLISGLSSYPIVIVSGLALGIDSIAHEAAISANLKTLSVPGSGIHPDVIYPVQHRGLSERILESGGCLLSEFTPYYLANPLSFPVRNRIMAGLSDAILIIEAEMKSGTLITSRLATEYNRDVLAVPGSIFSKNSEGTHFLIRSGATPITTSKDILEALGLEQIKNNIDSSRYIDCSTEEMQIIEKLQIPTTRDELMEALPMSTSKINSSLTVLELKGLINESGGQLYLK